MQTVNLRPLAVAFACVLAGAAQGAHADSFDDQMYRLSQDSGCSLCHSMHPEKARPHASPPAAPSWSEIALRYRNEPGAQDRLVATVLHGTGPENRHWESRTSVPAMPGNRVEISEEDARLLMRWILGQTESGHRR